MWQKGLYVLLGIVVTPAVKGIVKGVGRPVTREVIRFGILASDKIQEIAHEVREDFEDLTAEARAEIKRDAPPSRKRTGKKDAS